MKVEKYILKQSMHLGHIKQSFPKGTLISKDIDDNTLTIDGTKFNSTKDLDILKKFGWVNAYTEQSMQKMENEISADEKLNPKKAQEKKEKMEIVDSDADMFPVIDISHTKTKKKEAVKKTEKMEIIEQRVAKMKNEIPKIPVVNDEGSLSMGMEKKPSLNSGTVKTLNPQSIEKAKKIAEARKVKKPKIEAKTPIKEILELDTGNASKILNLQTPSQMASDIAKSKVE
jgi:hypothetical protein